MIFNTHTHLNDSRVENVAELVKNANNLGVTHMAVVGSDLLTSKKAIEIAKQYNHIYAICGIHPCDIPSFLNQYEVLKSYIEDLKTIGIGEIGLDYHYDDVPKETQLFYFEEFLKLACLYKKPVIIHCREAYNDTFQLLEKYHKQLDGIIMHCYSGSVEMMQRFIKLGCYISIAGTVTFKNAKEIKEVAKTVPLNKLLVETDDPYLTPVPFRGQQNQPAYVTYVIEEIASLRNMTKEEISKQTYLNACEVFHL